MAFTRTQLQQLKAKLDPKHIKTRLNGGATLHYIEGWYAIAEANRIFGFEGWDRETISNTCIWSGKRLGDQAAAYLAKVRITVRAGETLIVREGSGSGEAKAYTIGQAHDLAMKSAETDATKRALASFGNGFGLALYDPELLGVKGGRDQYRCNFDDGPWLLRSADGEQLSSHSKPADFVGALRRGMQHATSIEDLFGLWEKNLPTVRSLHRAYRRSSGSTGADGIELVVYLRTCARGFAGCEESKTDDAPEQAATEEAGNIDKSVLALAEPRRKRSKEHLRFVAQQPCVICGRSPCQAHHVRYAQPRSLSLKVSDEFTVPLCASHHRENHSTGDERCWWQRYKIDPLAAAARLWAGTSRGESPQITGPSKLQEG